MSLPVRISPSGPVDDVSREALVTPRTANSESTLKGRRTEWTGCSVCESMKTPPYPASNTRPACSWESLTIRRASGTHPRTHTPTQDATDLPIPAQPDQASPPSSPALHRPALHRPAQHSTERFCREQLTSTPSSPITRSDIIGIEPQPPPFHMKHDRSGLLEINEMSR